MKWLSVFVFISCSQITLNKTSNTYFGDKVSNIYYVTVWNLDTGKTYRATGVAVGSNEILTVSHIFPASSNFRINVYDKFRKYPGELLEIYRDADFSIIRVPKNIKLLFKISSKPVLKGSKVHILTEGKRNTISWKKAVVKEVSTFLLKVTGDYPKGYSGSLVLDADQNLLGILVRSNCEEVDKEKYGVILRIEAVRFITMGEI